VRRGRWRQDGVLDDPRTCSFDLTTLPSCLTTRGSRVLHAAERAAMTKLYTPLKTGTLGDLSPHPFGGEVEPAGWQNWITGINQPITRP
jgi:hypothetical protein